MPSISVEGVRNCISKILRKQKIETIFISPIRIPSAATSWRHLGYTWFPVVIAQWCEWAWMNVRSTSGERRMNDPYVLYSWINRILNEGHAIAFNTTSLAKDDGYYNLVCGDTLEIFCIQTTSTKTSESAECGNRLLTISRKVRPHNQQGRLLAGRCHRPDPSSNILTRDLTETGHCS